MILNLTVFFINFIHENMEHLVNEKQFADILNFPILTTHRRANVMCVLSCMAVCRDCVYVNNIMRENTMKN